MHLRLLRGYASSAFLLALAACAGEEDGLTGGNGGSNTGGQNIGGSVDGAGGSGGATGGGSDGGASIGGSGGGEGGAGGALSGNIELCVLNEGEAFDACQQPEEVDFGVVSSGTTETRLFRVDNETFDEALFKSVSVNSNQFTAVAVRFEEDPGDPGSYLRIEEDLPFSRQSGASLWFEISYSALGSPGPLPDLDVVVKMNVDDQPIADLLVPIVGDESGCGVGTGACDADPNNGCETNTDTSTDHCGQCNVMCDPTGGTGACVGGVCELAGCDPFMENCDFMDDNGCEVNILNDSLHCGSCDNSCFKDNTDAFCNGGNCNIVGCTNNYGDCNLLASDGCEINLANTMAHCGGCNLNCDLPNAAESCVPNQINGLGACTLGACASGYENCNLVAADGCEVHTDSDLQNCGNCFSVCDYANASESCVAGGCNLGMCDQGFGNCNGFAADGCEVTLDTDKDHCGTCATDCDVVFPGSVVGCSNGGCEWNGCLPNFWNNDGNLANGCEYACTAVAGPDLPDNGFADTNCDGIDGDVNEAIFVASGGNDLGPGTRAAPMASINAAIGKAEATGKTQVYVSNGIYSSRVTLTSGISIYGGYSATNGWVRNDLYVSTIRSGNVSDGRVTALEGVNITTATRVDQMRIETLGTSSAGISNYAVYCRECGGLTLSNNDIFAGNAGPGGSGSAGVDGANGSVGGGGSGSSCDSNSSGAAGGSAGGSSCRSGGAGGRGGNFGDNNGVAGATGVSGTPGGSGGNGGDPGSPGNNGSPGSNGSNGAAGSAGSGGSGGSGVWGTDAGGSGSFGGYGNGGGGGGGGGGQGCTFCNDGPGNGGGGGGGAGCRGTPGSGGLGGGGSFGLFLYQSSGILLVNNTIQSGNGGNGGNGGVGGDGGTGANGGVGGSVCTGEVGRGGNGGKGGNGGDGGGGGGGAGGPSWGVYKVSTTVNVSGNTLVNGVAGSGGNGGNPNGNDGMNGAAGTVN